jgi:hypothetical protein
LAPEDELVAVEIFAFFEEAAVFLFCLAAALAAPAAAALLFFSFSTAALLLTDPSPRISSRVDLDNGTVSRSSPRKVASSRNWVRVQFLETLDGKASRRASSGRLLMRSWVAWRLIELPFH